MDIGIASEMKKNIIMILAGLFVTAAIMITTIAIWNGNHLEELESSKQNPEISSEISDIDENDDDSQPQPQSESIMSDNSKAQKSNSNTKNVTLTIWDNSDNTVLENIMVL